jgi:hypothetical protein
MHVHRALKAGARGYLLNGTTLTIPANFMLIATLDKHRCMENGRLNLAGTDSVATKKSRADFGVRFQADLPCFCAVSSW